MENETEAARKPELCTSYVLVRCAVGFCITFGIAIISSALEDEANLLWARVILGGVLPPLVWMVWFGNAIGANSLDRRQAFIVFCISVLSAYLLNLLHIFIFDLTYEWEITKISRSNTMNSESACCAQEYGVQSVCVCPLTALQTVSQSAIPEELLKYFVISMYSHYSYVADPNAVLSLSFICGSGFAMVENILFIDMGHLVLQRIILSFPLHIVCQLIMGIFISRRKFVYKESGQTRVCCDAFRCSGKMPWWKIVALPVLIHSLHNFIGVLMSMSGSKFIDVGTYVLLFVNLGVSYTYLRFKYVQLHFVKRVNVRRLQQEGALPAACFCTLCYNSIERSNLIRRMSSIYGMENSDVELDAPATALTIVDDNNGKKENFVKP